MKRINLGFYLILSVLTATTLADEATANSSSEKSPVSSKVGASENQLKRRFEVVQSLAKAGRIEDAIRAGTPDCSGAVSHFTYLAEQSRKAGKFDEAIKFYQAYFDYYALLSGQDYLDQYFNKYAFDYVILLQKTNSPRCATEVPASAIYRQILQKRQTVKGGKKRLAICYRLTDQLLEKYPDSIFVPTAVLQVAHDIDWGYGLNGAAEQSRSLLRYEERMGKRGTPVRFRITVLAPAVELGEAMYDMDKPRQLGLQACRRIVALSRLDVEKRSFQLQLAKLELASSVSDKSAANRALRLYEELVRQWPRSAEGAAARRAIVDFHLHRDGPRKALKTVRAYQTKQPASDFSSVLLNIAQRETGQAQVDLLTEITQRYPKGEAYYPSWMALAEHYRIRKQVEQEAAVWERIAASSRPEGGAGLHFVQAQSRAIAFLGRRAEQKGDWEEALKWWRLWRSGSWCGNAIETATTANALKIFNCLIHLQREPEAIKSLETAVLQSGVECDEGAMVTMIDYHRQQGTLPEFEQRLNDILKRPFVGTGARMSRLYIDLLNASKTNDVMALWQPFLERSHSGLYHLSWREKMAGKLLAEMGEAAKPFLLAKAKTRGNSQQEKEEALWACIILGQMKAPETFAIVQQKWNATHDQETRTACLHALLLLGTPQAYELLKIAAEKAQSPIKQMAKYALKTYPAGTPVPGLAHDVKSLNRGPVIYLSSS